jgi:hypothetical protein
MHIITVLRLMTHINIGATLALLAWLAMHLGAGPTLSLASENAPQRDQFWPDARPQGGTPGHEDGQRWVAAAHAQPTMPRSDRLLASQGGV